MNRDGLNVPRRSRWLTVIVSTSFVAAMGLVACSGDSAPPLMGSPPVSPPRTDAGSLLGDAATNGDGSTCTYCGGKCVDVKTDPANCGGCGHICSPAALPEHASPACGAGSCSFVCHDGYELSAGSSCVRSIGAPRPLAPLSTSHTTQRRPTLKWALADTTDGAQLELCPTRGCDHDVQTYIVDGDRFTLPADLAPGVHFWRARGRAARAVGTKVSPTWEFFVPRPVAGLDPDGGQTGTPVATDTSWGTVADFNGDGFADAVVADPGMGRLYVYPGGRSGISDGSRTTVTVPQGGTQYVLASAADVDGDGFADLVLGVKDAGKVYVFRGGLTGLATSPSYTLGSPYGVASDGGATNFGAAVASAGDLNGDGYSDLVVGACALGRVLVYRGGAHGVVDDARLELTAPTATDTGFGCAVATGADVDGDGYNDLIIGAPRTNNGVGAVHLYLGGPAELSRAPSLSIPGPDVAGGNFGQALASAGDVDGDGYADLVVGAPGSNQGTGRAYVFRGSPAALSLEPSAVLDGPNGKGALFGSVVTGVGDVDGDGYDDFVVTAPVITGLNPVGRVHVFRGGAGALPSAPAYVLTGPDGGSFGGSLGCGDFDGDGFADLLVGTLGTPGRAYVFRGASIGLTGTPNALLVAPDGTSTTFGGAMARVSPFFLSPRTRRCGG